jgi:hypothetical protein
LSSKNFALLRKSDALQHLLYCTRPLVCERWRWVGAYALSASGVTRAQGDMTWFPITLSQKGCMRKMRNVWGVKAGQCAFLWLLWKRRWDHRYNTWGSFVVEPYASATGDIPPEVLLYTGTSGANEFAVAQPVGYVRDSGGDALDVGTLSLANGISPNASPAQAYEIMGTISMIDVAVHEEMMYHAPTP